MTDSTPDQPRFNPPSTPPASTPGKKSLWVWLLGGCAVIAIIGVIVVSGFLWWGYHKAKNYVNKELSLGNMNTVSQLWDDVPKMDGMTPTQNDMPLPVKLLVRAILGNLGRLNKPGEDRTTGNIDWLVFSATKPPEELGNYYTSDRMAEHGWERSDSPCLSGSEQGVPQVATFCVFRKQQGGRETQLAIIGWQDSSSNETNVFFLRLTPDKQSS